MVTDMIKWH